MTAGYISFKLTAFVFIYDADRACISNWHC